MEDMLRVGVITSTHGIKGEVKVFPTTDDPLRFKELKKCIIDGKREQANVTVSSVKFFKQFVIVKFKEFDDINDILSSFLYFIEFININEYSLISLISASFITCSSQDNSHCSKKSLLKI